MPAAPLTYAEFGRLRLRDFLPSGINIVEQPNFEWMNGSWWREGIAFTWFGRLMNERDHTAGLELLFEELDLGTVKQILASVGLPLHPGMRITDLEELFGMRETTHKVIQDQWTYNFRVGSTETYQVGCTVHDNFGLIHISMIRSDVRRTLALAAAGRRQT